MSRKYTVGPDSIVISQMEFRKRTICICPATVRPAGKVSVLCKLTLHPGYSIYDFGLGDWDHEKIDLTFEKNLIPDYYTQHRGPPCTCHWPPPLPRRPAVATRDVADHRHFVHIPVAFVLAVLVPLLLFLQADFLGLGIIKETPRANDGEREREREREK